MEPLFQFDLPKDQSSIIKVFGVGGGGSNAVNHMHDQGIVGVNFVVLNTDAQALEMSRIPNKIQLGPALTQGLGAGARPEIGEKSAEESVDAIKELLNKNTKMVFITAGMGGGTGTGAAPVVARIAREMGVLTVGIVTTPFWFEGKSRYGHAVDGIEKLRENVDTLLIINNDKIREMYGNLKRSEAFGHANNILTTAAKAISEIITVPGEINVDFADVQTVMKNGGSAIMGCATAEGEDRALRAASGALNSPLLNDNEIRGAKKVLVNITTGTAQVTMDEIGVIMEYVQDAAGSTDIILGACDDPSLGDKLSVTIIATGFEVGKKTPAYVEQKVVKVYELNDKPVVNETAAPVVEAKTEVLELPVVNETPLISEQPVLLNLEEEKYDLFDVVSTTEETSENTYEFEVTREEQVLPEVELTQEVVVEAKVEEPTIQPVLETRNEEYVVYTKKSYETDSVSSIHQEDMNKQLEDRKKILAGLSYRFGSKQNVGELENEPAYKRRGLDVNGEQNFSTVNDVSRYSVSDDGTNRPEIKKNNSFLHDNVD
ncbi:MAG TPA: cell division protein FtsZ [Chitinophagales bacterium]|nr:cell division protein FtsZ [Chitinophagales bacterium]